MKYTTALITLATLAMAASDTHDNAPGHPLAGAKDLGLQATTTTLAARQAEVTVNTGAIGDAIRKADHDGDDDDDDSAEFRSGVGSFVSKVTSAVGGAFDGTATPTPTPQAGANKEDENKKSGAGMVSVREGGLGGYLLTGAAVAVGVGAFLL